MKLLSLTFFAIFIALFIYLTPITDIWMECFVMLGMHSELHMCQMSHVYDISPLRVKNWYTSHTVVCPSSKCFLWAGPVIHIAYIIISIMH